MSTSGLPFGTRVCNIVVELLKRREKLSKSEIGLIMLGT